MDLCLNTLGEILSSLGLKSQRPLGVWELRVANCTERELQLGSMNLPVGVVPRQQSRNYGANTDIRNLHWNLFCCSSAHGVEGIVLV